MRGYRHWITLFIGLALAGSMIPLAEASTTQTKQPTPRTHMIEGTIVSVKDNSMVVSHGKTKMHSSFELNSATKKEGSLASGEAVTVHYQIKGKDRIATDVSVSGQKPPAASKTEKSKT